MDESAYGVARGALNPLPCAFEKALLAGAAGCALASRRALAERETVACTSAIAQANCRLPVSYTHLTLPTSDLV